MLRRLRPCTPSTSRPSLATDGSISMTTSTRMRAGLILHHVSARSYPGVVIVKWAVIIIALVIIAGLLAGQLGLLKGTPPTDLGVHDGKLKSPSKTPNSVSSQASLYPDHPQRDYADIAPFPVSGGPARYAESDSQHCGRMEGAKIVARETSLPVRAIYHPADEIC